MSDASRREPGPWVGGFGRTLAFVENVALSLAALCVISVILMTAADVVGRYVFNRSLGWAYDGALVLMVGLCFLSAASVQARNGNVSVNFVHRLFPRNGRRLLALFQLLAVAFVLVLISWMNARYAMDAWRAGWVYGGFGIIPTWLPYSFIAFGSLLVALRALLQTVLVLIDDDAARVHVDPEEELEG